MTTTSTIAHDHSVTHPLQSLFDKAHAGWVGHDPDLIASAHSADTVFDFHGGTGIVHGREALRQSAAGIFAQYPTFRQESRVLLFGDAHWVYEWVMLIDLADAAGETFTARIDMLDVIDVNTAGEIARKDVYMNGLQYQAAFARAGLSSPGAP
jgi:hypothetical protein